MNRIALALIIGFLAFAVTLVAVFAVKPVYIFDGLQLIRHYEVLDGTAPKPWCWRVLTAWLAEGIHFLLGSYGWSFIFLRFILTATVFGLLYAYARQFGNSVNASLLVLCLFQSIMVFGCFNSDLSFNSIFEAGVFLAGAIIVLSGGSLRWFLPLVVVGVLNRETAVFLPALILASERKDRKFWFVLVSAVGGILMLLLYLKFRWNPLHGAVLSPLGMLQYNIHKPATYVYLTMSFGILPIIAARNMGGARLFRTWIFFALGWFVFHLLMGRLEETRLLWVPLALLLPMVMADKREIQCQ